MPQGDKSKYTDKQKRQAEHRVSSHKRILLANSIYPLKSQDDCEKCGEIAK